MPYIRLTHRYIYNSQFCENTYHYATPNVAPTAAIMEEIAGDFVTEVLPGINGVQVSQVANASIIAYAPNVGFTVEVDADGNGSIASIPAGNIAPDIALLIKRNLGSTFANANGAPYTGNRPIRRGRFFLSGLPKNFMVQSGFTEDTFGADWTAFRAAMLEPLEDASNNSWFPVVVGEALNATLTKDARPLAYAPIVSVTEREFTNLGTRDVT